ncbi:hypothetical protein BBJ28_00006717 [Nothophytophthora sp. Chile5]|nr:hypothetical protein BBJ28_00006717 [Nothophytophthora sp. Chile5]
MDSLGFDFGGGDLLDLGSLGSWTNNTPMGNSPNGSGGLPFSVGTPTGVQSLGDDPFAAMPSGGDNDFSFGDSPKPSPSSAARKPADGAATAADDLTSPYFGSELEAGRAGATATSDASAEDNKTKLKLKVEGDVKPKKESTTSATSAAAAATSNATSAASTALKSEASSASTATSAPSSSAATSSASTAFAGQSYQHQQQTHAGPMAAGPNGAPPSGAAGQYMSAAQAYRSPTSTYEEEFARVKAMMMQHPDLIPPPMEVLRISMSQSAANQQQSMANAAYMQQRGGPAMPRGAAAGNAAAAYAQYGNPNMMMGGPQQNAQQAGMMNAARMRAAQMAQQQAQQRAAAGRTPSGANPADSQAAWQSENDLPLRRKMIGKMYATLQRKPDAPAEWIRRLPDMARRLEDSLYRTAKNRDEYGDFSAEMNLGESSDFLNLDLSQSLLGSDDLQGDGSSGLNGSGADAIKNGSNEGNANMSGMKRTLSQSQQQMAAAANAAAFKRTKVGGAGQAGGQPGVGSGQRPGNATSGPQTSQPSMQKPVTSTNGSSKTPPMSTVNAK